MRLKDIILPEDLFFLTIFRKIAADIYTSSSHLSNLVINLDKGGVFYFQEIHHLEHECDENIRKIYERLEESLITPLEPEEIHRLAKALDDVIDIIDWVSHQICNYQIKGSYSHLFAFADFISLATKEIQKGVDLLGEWEKKNEIKNACTNINQIWNRSSDLLSASVTELFTGNDPIEVIKLKDIYENLEEVLQECNDVGHVLSEIITRHS